MIRRYALLSSLALVAILTPILFPGAMQYSNAQSSEGTVVRDSQTVLLEGYEVECPWHGSKFDVRTGEPTKPPAVRAVPKYEVKIDGNNILVRKQK